MAIAAAFKPCGVVLMVDILFLEALRDDFSFSASELERISYSFSMLKKCIG
jgi:hypothetical protein